MPHLHALLAGRPSSKLATQECEETEEFVETLVGNNLLELLVQNLSRLDEKVAAPRKALMGCV